MNCSLQDKEYLKELTILFVEDNDDVFEQGVQFLSRIVTTVLTARDGAEGLGLYQTGQPDIVITDIHMPRMDGLTMATEIRRLDSSVPIIVMTGFEQVDYLRRIVDIGVDKYLTKPINLPQLHATLLECAHGLRVERQLQVREEQLRESHKQLTDLTRQIPGVVFQYRLFADGTSAFPYTSDAIQQFFGLTPEQLRHNASLLFTLIHADDQERVVTAIMDSASTFKPWQFE